MLVQDGPDMPPPSRRIVLVWRRSFTRYEAIAALRNAIYACEPSAEPTFLRLLMRR